MNLFYITNNRLPTERAHGIQIAKMCEAFVNNGVDLELIYPDRKNVIKDSFFDYYNIKKNFKLTKIKSWDLVGVIPNLGFRIQSLTFAWNVFVYLFNKKNSTIIYSRDPFSSLVLSFNKQLKIVFEIHSLPNRLSFYHKFLFKRVCKIIAISNGLKTDLINLGVNSSKVLVSPDGVDVIIFNQSIGDKQKIRAKLQLPVDKKIFLYSGHLYQWKGVNILAEAANKLNSDCLVVFVGGTLEDLKKFSLYIKNNELKNILLIGHKKYSEIPLYLKSADFLVLPNSGKEKISSHYTSPMKLFEYMASGIPIISSGLPSIREILNENNAIFFEADNATDLADKIKYALNNLDLCGKLALQASKDAFYYDWDNRAKNIIKFIKNS